MRQEELFFLCCALVKAGMTVGERGDAARRKDPTHPFCPYQTRLCSSSICYLRLPFCNDALFLVDAFMSKKGTKAESCGVICVVTMEEDGLRSSEQLVMLSFKVRVQ